MNCYITFTKRGGEIAETIVPEEKWDTQMGAMLRACGAPPDVIPSEILCLTVRKDRPYEDDFIAQEH